MVTSNLCLFYYFSGIIDYINLGREEKIIMTYTGKMNKSFIDDIANSINRVIRETSFRSKTKSKKKNLDITFSFSDLSEPKKELLLLTIRKIKDMKEEDVLFFIDSINQCEKEKGYYNEYR